MLLGYWSPSCLLCFHKGKAALLYSPPKTLQSAGCSGEAALLQIKTQPNINQITWFFFSFFLFWSSIGKWETHKMGTTEEKMIEKQERKHFPLNIYCNWEFRNKSSSKIIMREIWHSQLVNWNQVLQSLCFHCWDKPPRQLPLCKCNHMHSRQMHQLPS